MSKVIPEKIIQAQILNYLTMNGLYIWRNNSTAVFDASKKVFRKARSKHSINGSSDILGILPDGRFLAIEVKSATGRASPDQIKFINAINSNGGLAFIARSIDDVIKHLDQYLKFKTL